METFQYPAETGSVPVVDGFACGTPHRWRSLLSAALVTLCAVSCSTPPPEVPAMSGAIQVNEPDHDAWAAALQAEGLDALQVTLYARQLAWDSAQMILPDDSSAVIHEIRAAKRAGLRVTLVLRVALEQALPANRHAWHGMIWPPEDEVDAWFATYREFALDGAAIAVAEGVDMLAIGSELNSLTSTVPLEQVPDLYAYFLDPQRTAPVRQRLVDCAAGIPAAQLAPDLRFVDGGSYDTLEAFLLAQEDAARSWTQHVTGAARGEDVDLGALNRRRARYERNWRDVAAAVRTVYPGPISYAANFDQVDEVGFWDALDAIGVNAYFPLSTYGLSGTRLQGALSGSWLRIARNLNGLAQRYGGPARVLPVLLFELGWTRKAGSTVRPFSYHRVEVLETAPAPDDGAAASSLTCVHWATQPEDPFERVEALRALDRVVAEGSFPTLRGFTLWKLSTDPGHRAVEPFVVVLPSAGRADDTDEADRLYLEAAAALARRLRDSAAARR